jgi:CubicO group peptidase (beta-lactamase class C family)
MSDDPTMTIQGHCDDRFRDVADEFERNFTERGDLGASVCVKVGGETVVDLWGGWSDAARQRAWDKDTLAVLMSCTKGATALCAHLLRTSGDLDFDEPVATYWPEFAAKGKEGVLVRHVLAHQAGLPALRDEVPAGRFYDAEYMAERLAAEALFWEPGTAYGYHALTFGYLVGEIVRRVTGRSLGEFFAEEVARPLGLDLWIGLPPSEHSRVAGFYPPSPPAEETPISRFTLQSMTDPTSIPFLVMGNNGGYLVPGEWDSAAAISATNGSSGGVGNARSLAAMYHAIVHDGTIGRFTIDAEDVVQMAAVQSALTEDRVLMGPGRWTLGFHKGALSPKLVQPEARISLSEDAFGHSGFGGSMGFADRPADLSFAYVMNQMALDMGLSPTGQSLIDATYRALGYRRRKYDVWVR